MSERKYERLANILIMVTIVSALLFDSGKFSHVFMGSLGVAAALAAMALYIINQRDSAAIKQNELAKGIPAHAYPNFIAEQSGANPRDDNGMYVAASGKYADISFWQIIRGDQIELFTIKAYDPHVVFSRQPAVQSLRHCSSRHWYLGPAHSLQHQPEVLLSPNDVAACAIQIMRHLSSGNDRDRWEFSFGPNGLRVLSKNDQAQRPTIPQEDFDSGQLPSTMVQ